MGIKRGDLFLGYCGKETSICVALSEGYVDEYDGFTYVPILDENLIFHLCNSVLLIKDGEQEELKDKFNQSVCFTLGSCTNAYDLICSLFDVKVDYHNYENDSVRFGLPLFTVKRNSLIAILGQMALDGIMPEFYYILDSEPNVIYLSLYKDRCRSYDYQFGRIVSIEDTQINPHNYISNYQAYNEEVEPELLF